MVKHTGSCQSQLRRGAPAIEAFCITASLVHLIIQLKPMCALLIDDSNSDENWADALALWGRISNWARYKPSEHLLRGEIKQFLIALWNEKDWLKHQYPTKAREIEKFVDSSKYLPIVADLANMAKRRHLTKMKRSRAVLASYFGRVSLNNGAVRRMHFIATGDGGHIETMEFLCNALSEPEEFRFELLAQARQSGL